MSYTGEIYDVDVQELTVGSCVTHGLDNVLGVSLMPHQQRALARCREMEDSRVRQHDDAPGTYMKTSIGIYGDAVGTGKSHVMLALVAGDSQVSTITELTDSDSDSCVRTRLRTFADGKIRVSEVDNLRPIKTSVIAIPHALTSQWEGYVKTMQEAGAVKVLVVSRKKALDRLTPTNIREFDLIVVTNSFYEDLCRILVLHRLRVRRLVVDEADTIVITSSMTIAARFTWFVTASYGNLMFPMGNARYEPLLRQSICVAKGLVHQGFIRMLFLKLHATLFRSHFRRLVVKNSAHSIQTSMQESCMSVRHEMVPSLTPHSIRVLTGIVDRVVIECLNAGDVASAVKQIAPENRHTEQNVVMLMAESYTDRLRLIERKVKSLTESAESQSPEFVREVCRLTKIAGDLTHKVDCMRIRLLEDDVCCICLDKAELNAVVPCCTTKMCFECITRWVVAKSSCVLCRKPLNFSDLHVIEPGEKSNNVSVEVVKKVQFDNVCGAHNTKMQNLEVILRHHVRGNTMIFSNYEKSFEAICACLTSMGKTYDYLRGGHRQISNTVESYKDGRTDVLLINPTHYGGGLNLENTTDILMFHALNTEVEKQVIGRAHRMGRTSDLRVWHLLHENELQHAAETAAAMNLHNAAMLVETFGEGGGEDDATAGADQVELNAHDVRSLI